MARPAVASKACGVFPILAASRADAARLKSIPNAPTTGPANPTVRWMWNPLALRTEYFYFSHIAPLESLTSQFAFEAAVKVGREHGVQHRNDLSLQALQRVHIGRTAL